MKKIASFLLLIIVATSSIAAYSETNMFWSGIRRNPFSYSANYFSLNAIGSYTTPSLSIEENGEFGYGVELAYHMYFYQSSKGLFVKSKIKNENNLLSYSNSTGVSFRIPATKDFEIYISGGPELTLIKSSSVSSQLVDLTYLGSNIEMGARFIPDRRVPGFQFNVGFEADSLWFINSKSGSKVGSPFIFAVNPFVGFTIEFFGPRWTDFANGPTVKIYM